MNAEYSSKIYIILFIVSVFAILLDIYVKSTPPPNWVIFIFDSIFRSIPYFISVGLILVAAYFTQRARNSFKK